MKILDLFNNIIIYLKYVIKIEIIISLNLFFDISNKYDIWYIWYLQLIKIYNQLYRVNYTRYA